MMGMKEGLISFAESEQSPYLLSSTFLILCFCVLRAHILSGFQDLIAENEASYSKSPFPLAEMPLSMSVINIHLTCGFATPFQRSKLFRSGLIRKIRQCSTSGTSIDFRFQKAEDTVDDAMVTLMNLRLPSILSL